MSGQDTSEPRSATAADLAGRLLVVLRRLTGVASLGYSTDPLPLTGGFWAELVSFSLSDAPPGWEGELVARVMPDAAVAAKETAVQRYVASQGFPTPRVRGAATAETELGRAVLVMDRVDGKPMLGGLGGWTALTAAPRLFRSLPIELAEVMARLHELDPGPVLEALSDSGVAASVAELLRGVDLVAATASRDDLRMAAAWLFDHPVAGGPDVVCHGDLHPFNLLVDRDGTVTVLDWSTALLAPREYDLAFTTLV